MLGVISLQTDNTAQEEKKPEEEEKPESNLEAG